MSTPYSLSFSISFWWGTTSKHFDRSRSTKIEISPLSIASRTRSVITLRAVSVECSPNRCFWMITSQYLTLHHGRQILLQPARFYPTPHKQGDRRGGVSTYISNNLPHMELQFQSTLQVVTCSVRIQNKRITFFISFPLLMNFFQDVTNDAAVTKTIYVQLQTPTVNIAL